MEFDATFNCNGKVNSNDWQLSRTSFVRAGELESILDRSKEHRLTEANVVLFDHVLPASVAALNLSHFAKCMEMQLKILNRYESYERIAFSSANDDEDFYEIRKSVCNFVSYVRTYLFSLEQQCQESRKSFLEMEAQLDDTLAALRKFFARLRRIPDSTFHYAASNLGNKCSQPEFHMYHVHLELRWHFVTIVHARMIYLQSLSLGFEDMDVTLQLVFDDLVYVSMKMFERINITDLRLKNPYSCTCARELWLMMQIFLEDAAPNIKCKSFWEFLNSSLEKVLTNTESRQGEEEKIFWHSEEEKEFSRSKNPELFAAWLIYHLALLHGYDRYGSYVGTSSKRVEANYDQIDRILKGFVNKGGKDGNRDELDEELRVMIPLIRVLADEWWPTRVQIISFLWDCFHRRLEQPFLLQTSGPWTVNVISCRKDDNARAMMASFVDTFGQIISSSEKLDNGEHHFVGGWIDRYLLECPKNRIGVVLKILLEILEKCSRSENHRSDSGISKALDALWSYVASRIRQLVFEPAITGDNYVDLAKLSVAFTIEAIRNPVAAKRHKHSSTSLFQHFTSSIIVKDVRVTKCYIAAILRNDNIVKSLKSEVKNFDLVVIQAWIKCCFLGLDASKDDDMRFLKSRVLIIPEIRKLFSSQAEIIEFENNEESIFVFFMALVKFRIHLKTEQERTAYDARVRLYFTNIDKWALAIISEETRDTDIAFWIYRCVGTLIFHCSTILYVKNQPNNGLRVLISKFVLPGEQSPQTYLKHLGKRIFSMIMLGIERLSARSDLSLQALIRDLFDAYLPILVTEDSGNFKIAESLLRCFAEANIDFSCLIFEKLAANFIIVSGDNATHKHCYLVMLLLKNLLKSGKSYGNHTIEFIVAICVPNVVSCCFKVHDLHPHKQQTLDLISDVTTNIYYREDSSLSTRCCLEQSTNRNRFLLCFGSLNNCGNQNVTRVGFGNCENPRQRRALELARECVVLGDKLKSTVVAIVVKFITFHTKFAFDFLRSLNRINGEILDKALPQIEKIVVDLEKSRRPNAAALRYSLSQLQSVRKNT